MPDELKRFLVVVTVTALILVVGLLAMIGLSTLLQNTPSSDVAAAQDVVKYPIKNMQDDDQYCTVVRYESHSGISRYVCAIHCYHDTENEGYATSVSVGCEWYGENVEASHMTQTYAP